MTTCDGLQGAAAATLMAANAAAQAARMPWTDRRRTAARARKPASDPRFPDPDVPNLVKVMLLKSLCDFLIHRVVLQKSHSSAFCPGDRHHLEGSWQSRAPWAILAGKRVGAGEAREQPQASYRWLATLARRRARDRRAVPAPAQGTLAVSWRVANQTFRALRE